MKFSWKLDSEKSLFHFAFRKKEKKMKAKKKRLSFFFKFELVSQIGSKMNGFVISVHESVLNTKQYYRILFVNHLKKTKN